MTAQDASRKAFEEAYIAEKLRIIGCEGSEQGERFIRTVMLNRNGLGDYDNSREAHFAWWAWQHQAARIAELERENSYLQDGCAELEAQVKALQREPLSDGEIKNIIAGLEHSPRIHPHGFARAIEAAHNIRAKGGE